MHTNFALAQKKKLNKKVSGSEITSSFSLFPICTSFQLLSRCNKSRTNDNSEIQFCRRVDILWIKTNSVRALKKLTHVHLSPFFCCDSRNTFLVLMLRIRMRSISMSWVMQSVQRQLIAHSIALRALIWICIAFECVLKSYHEKLFLRSLTLTLIRYQVFQKNFDQLQ